MGKNDLLHKYQSRFCANFSKDSCLTQLTDFILRVMGKGFHTKMILVDLQKAFKKLENTTLLQKMESISFKESFIKWFISYFSNRKCLVALEDVFSDVGLINCGVPQGYILGLLLFLIYHSSQHTLLYIFWIVMPQLKALQQLILKEL